MIQRWFHCRDVVSEQVDLHITKRPNTSTNLILSGGTIMFGLKKATNERQLS